VGTLSKSPETLSEPERDRLSDVACKQESIEQRILASKAAANVVIPTATLKNRLDEIRKRYPSEEEFIQDMEGNGLNEANLSRAVERELHIEAVLEKSLPPSPQPLRLKPRFSTICIRKHSIVRRYGA
jgi:peptidylprolyl isomerase/peptidyl-prolyl cis-trans isomerase C